MTKLLTVGKHKITGEPVFIETARNGLKCDAVCPDCGSDVEARQGKSNDWSFAHDDSGTERPPCKAPYETALHFVSKWIIGRGKRIKLPGGKFFDYDQATIEKWVDRFRIDVQLFNTQDNQMLLVEIVVGNTLEDEKIAALTQLGYRILEIDLSDYEGAGHEGTLTTLLLDTTQSKTIHKIRAPRPQYTKPNFNPITAIIAFFALIAGWLLYRSLMKRK